MKEGQPGTLGGIHFTHTHKPITINTNQTTQIISVRARIKPISCQNKSTNHNPFTSICNHPTKINCTKTNINYRTRIHVRIHQIKLQQQNHTQNDTQYKHYITSEEATKKSYVPRDGEKMYGWRPSPGSSSAEVSVAGRRQPPSSFEGRP